MTKKTEYIGFRADKQTVDRIHALQTKEDNVSSVIRYSIDFYYEYIEGLLDLLEEED